jgi:hypothetical protein
MKRVLSGIGVVPIAHDEDKDNDNGGGGGGGNHIEDDDNGDDAVGKGKLLSSYLLCDIKQICLQERGAAQRQVV